MSLDIESRDDLKNVLDNMVRLEDLTTMVHGLVTELIDNSDLWITTRRGEPTLYIIIDYEKDKAGNMVTKDFSLEETFRAEFENHKYFKTDTYSSEVRVMIDWLYGLAEKLEKEFGDKIEAAE
jgi:hypothetical protein